MGPKPGDSASKQPERAGDMSGSVSPRQRPARDERGDGLSASYESTETVRRHPESGYGTIPSSTPTRSQSQLGGDAEPGPSYQGPLLQGPSYARVAASSPRVGSDRTRSTRSRNPGLSRRPSQNPLKPYPGEVFSVDDDIMEVEADAASQHRGPKRDQPQQGYGPRRRSVQPSPLVRQQSYNILEEPAEQEHRNNEPDDAGDDDSLHHSELQLEDHLDCDSDEDLSDAESFTLKDRQDAINVTHPFGIRLWKPALYKKSRSVQKTAEGDIHSVPGHGVSNWVLLFNVIWTLVFGWWMSLLAALGAVVCFIFIRAPGCRSYGRVLWGLSGYLFHPFGKLVRLEKDDAYSHEDRGEGRSVYDYERWQSGDLEYGRLFFGPEPNRSIVGRSRRSIDSSLSEADSLLGNSRTIERSDSNEERGIKRRLFGRGDWNLGRVIFFIFFYFLIAPVLILVSLTCWLLVFWIPMGKLTILLVSHLRRHPLALSFESGLVSDASPRSTILLCTYRAAGPRYWKYTIDGTNIFLINLMAVVVFLIFDWFVLKGILDLDIFVTSSAFMFPAGLLSIVPLAYFIGQAVASISAQSSMGLGAAINAFFATVVEVYLYCVALNQGKGALVEGSIVGSIFAGILFLPGLSMCFGAIKRKTQRFNAKSAGVTSTMLLFAVLGAFGPTLFHQIYGTHELYCTDCAPGSHASGGDCRRCFYSEIPALNDRFYMEAVRPYTYFAAAGLFFMYLIGLWFTLRTHAAIIWNTEMEEKKHESDLAQAVRHAIPHASAETTGADIRDSHLYKRILGQSLKQVGLGPREDLTRQESFGSGSGATATNATGSGTPHVVPPKADTHSNVNIPGFSEAENHNLVRKVAEVAATAAAFAVRQPRRAPHRPAPAGPPDAAGGSRPSNASQPRLATFPEPETADGGLPAVGPHGEQPSGGGHDAPNWSRAKSSVILLGATLFYAVIAEILVDSVDVVLDGFAVDEKFLGITLFALVPNTTEFLNAISFAMNGNIALSMEIGSAYALQVCMLQIPALVFYSALHTVVPLPEDPEPDMAKYVFTLLFPQWDMVTVIICVFLLSYMYGEGKSNYFKGSILLLSYLTVVIGFWFSDYSSAGGLEVGASRFDRMVEGEWVGFNTIGRGRRGEAF